MGQRGKCMRTREHIRAALRFLDELGAESKDVSATGSGHMRIEWQVAGKTYAVSAASSPSNRGTAAIELRREIKRQMNGYYELRRPS